MEKLKVSDLMTKKVFSIQANEDLGALYDLMTEIHVRHIPVVDDEGSLVGIVSQRDLLRSALYTEEELPESQMRDLLENIKVEEIMTADPETVEPDQEINEAGRLMLDNKLGSLPVVDGTNLVGILTEADFVKYVVDQESE